VFFLFVKQWHTFKLNLKVQLEVLKLIIESIPQ